MAVKIDSTIRTSAVVTNSKSGFVKLARPIAGSDVFKSMTLAKFADGALVELIFRVSNNTTPPSRQLVRATELSVNDRYWLALTAVTPGATLPEIGSLIAKALSFSSDGAADLQQLLASTGGDIKDPINLLEGLSYDEVWAFQEQLTGDAEGLATFEVVKHTVDNMPDNVSAAATMLVDNLEWVGHHWIPPKLRLMFVAARQTVANGGHINMMMKGESGYGKTSAYQAMGDWLGIPVVYINCATLQDTEQWFGYQEARDGSTIFIPTEFTKAIVGGNCIVILDEFNRIEPWVHNSLMPILDHRRRTTVHGEEIICGPGVIFGATINDGPRYAGTNTVDLAVLNRFDAHADVEAPPPNVEVEIVMKVFPNETRAEISKVVSTMNELRKNQGDFGMPVDISTRSTLKVVNLMSLGLTARQAAQYVIIFAAEQNDRKSLIDVVNMKLGTDKNFQ